MILRNAFHYQQEHRKALLMSVNGHKIALSIALTTYFRGILPLAALKFVLNVIAKLFSTGGSIGTGTVPV